MYVEQALARVDVCEGEEVCLRGEIPSVVRVNGEGEGEGEGLGEGEGEGLRVGVCP